MARSRLIKALAKVIIAAAWTDGSITNDEHNSLKDLLFQLPGMNARDWAELEIYMDAPVGQEERNRLVADLQQALTSRKDRDLAIRTLEDLLHADGDISENEQAVFEEIKAALEDVNTSIFGQVQRLMSEPVERRTDIAAQAPNRELLLDDFIRNRIFYQLSRHMKNTGKVIRLPEATLRKLSLAGGLMARIAYVDHKVTEDEFDHMAKVMQDLFHLEADQAGFVAEVAVSTISKDLDYYRLSREFFEATTEEERIRFLDVLFAVAAADGIVTHAEMEEIRTVSTVLKLGHKPFIDAKLKIPRPQRAY
jgi:uncharacterized tellurite resistance protein B-like protein